MLALFGLTAGLVLLVIVPPPVCGTGVPSILVGAVDAMLDWEVFAGEILVVMIGWEAPVDAALVDEPPLILVVIVPPPVCATGVPPMLFGAVAPVFGVAVFAGEILVVMLPGPFGVGDGTWACTGDDDCVALNTTAMAKRMLTIRCVAYCFHLFFMDTLFSFRIGASC